MNRHKLNEEDFKDVQEYINCMSQYSKLFTREEEEFHAIRKWNAQRRLEKILSDPKIHTPVQTYFLRKKEDTYQTLRETFSESEQRKLKRKISLYKSLLVKRHESYKKLEELKKQRSIKGLIDEQEKYSTILIEYIKEFNDLNGINQHFTQSKIEGLEQYKRIINKLCSRYEFEKNNFLTHNWSFAFLKAKKESGKGVPLIDLIQCANVGIIKAFERFDPNKKIKFITYAGWWIFDELTTAVCETGKTIKLASDIKDLIVRLKKTEDVLIKTEERKVSVDEVINYYETINGKIKIISRQNLEKAFCIFGAQPSLQDQSGMDFEFPPEISIESTEELPETICSKNEQIKKLKYCLSLLDEQDQKLLESIFGLNSAKLVQQTQMGKKFDISGKAIGLRKDRALEKLLFFWHRL